MLFRIAALLALAVPAAPAEVTVQAGQTATLGVRFDLRDQLLNRGAPNALTFTTPWGKVQGRPVGSVHADPNLGAYYGRVSPLALPVRVPPGTRPGPYPARLSGELYSCDVHDKVCSRQAIDLPVTVRVLGAGGRPVARPALVTDELLRPTLRLWP